MTMLRIGVLVLATTGFYSYVGQMVPQNEVQPPEEILISADLTTPEMVEIGRQVAGGKGLCMTCHTIGQAGALRFPDLSGVAGRATTRVPGLSDVEYFAQSLYEPDSYIVEGFNPGMPVINEPPIGLTDQEILVVIAYLQSLGGTPTVTLQTAHRYYTPENAEPPADAAADEGAAPDADAPPPAEGAALAPAALPRGLGLRPDTALVEVGREIAEGKGLCMTCHTIGEAGALQSPDLGGIAARATIRVPGMSDVEYFGQSMYEPDSHIVEGFNSGMPASNMPPIGLTDQEILGVIAYLQSLGGTPTVTLQTAHRYYTPENAVPPAEATGLKGTR